jgi:hypothetical protein
MGKSIYGLRTYQWGKESARGTLVAATSKIAVEDLEFDPQDKLDRPKIAKGLLHRNPGSETVITRGTLFRIKETPVIYDQIQNLFSMSCKGAVTPTGAGPYVWLYPVSLTADPSPDTWTLERRLSDGSVNVDNRWAYAFLTQIRFVYQIDQPLKFSAEGIARRVQTNAITAALALPTIEIPPVPLVQCWIDSTWANLGVTQVVAQVLRASLTFHTGLKPKLTFDGRPDLDFTTYIFDASVRGFDLELDMFVDSQYATEKTAAEAATARAIRLKVLGTGSRELTFDMLAKHDPASQFNVTQTDGQDQITYKLQDSDDGANFFAPKVVNAVATYV